MSRVKARRAKPPKAKPVKVWALYGYDNPDDPAVCAAYALDRADLPFGGWSSQNLMEKAEQVDTRNAEAREWYEKTCAPEFAEAWYDFLHAVGVGATDPIIEHPILRRIAITIATAIKMPPPSEALRHAAERVLDDRTICLGNAVDLARRALGRKDP